MRRTVLLAPAALGLAVITATAAAAATHVLVNRTETRSLGGAQICVAANCLPEIQGVKNVHLFAEFNGPDISRPTVTRTSAPGCSANVNIGYKLTTAGVGPGGTLKVLAEFDRTDKNGQVIPGSHQTITRTVVLPGLTSTTIDPLVSLCASVLEA